MVREGRDRIQLTALGKDGSDGGVDVDLVAHVVRGRGEARRPDPGDGGAHHGHPRFAVLRGDPLDRPPERGLVHPTHGHAGHLHVRQHTVPPDPESNQRQDASGAHARQHDGCGASLSASHHAANALCQ